MRSLCQDFHPIFLAVLMGMPSLYGQSGFVTLPGRYFELDGQPYYPRIMNYGMDFASLVHGSSTPSDLVITPAGAWDRVIASHYEEVEQDALLQQTRSHFQYLASIGFNAIRLYGAVPVMHWDQPGGTRHYSMEVKSLPTVDPRYMAHLSIPGFDDPISERLFELLRWVVRLADEEGLKVILLCADDLGGHQQLTFATDLEAVDTYADYLVALSAALKDEPGLLAYDLWNEPIWTNLSLTQWTKTDVCDFTTQWYDAIRSTGDRHLVTLGGASYDEAGSWDPAVMKIDFYSPHVYPHPVRSLGYDVDKALEVFEAHMHWLGRSCPIPWVIGETGFSAEDDQRDPLDFFTGPDNQHLDGVPAHHKMPWMNGSEVQQAEFAQRSMDAVRRHRGSGYSWWGFQNHRQANLSSEARDYRECWFGPLKFGNEAGLTSNGNPLPAPWNVENRWRPKEMVETLMEYELPPEPSELPPPPDNYYNWHGLTTPVVYDGYVEDQEEEAVADAVVGAVWNYYSDFEQTNLVFDQWDHVVTDHDGYFGFRILSPDFLFPLFNIRNVEGVGLTSVPAGPSGSTTFVSRHLLRYTNVVGPIAVLNGMDEDFKGRMELEVEGGVVGGGTGGGIADLYATSSVHVTGHFHADQDAELHIFNRPTFPECIEGGPKSSILADPLNTYAPIPERAPKAIELRFQRDGPKVTVFPIPARDLLNVTTDGEGFNYVVTDATGRVVLEGRSDRVTSILDVGGLSVGRYELRTDQNGASCVTSISIAR